MYPCTIWLLRNGPHCPGNSLIWALLLSVVWLWQFLPFLLEFDDATIFPLLFQLMISEYTVIDMRLIAKKTSNTFLKPNLEVNTIEESELYLL